MVVKVAAAKLSPAFGKNCFVSFRSLECRLMGIGPERPARHIAQITECAPVIAGRVFAPARHRQVFPAAVAAACIRHHHVVMAVR